MHFEQIKTLSSFAFNVRNNAEIIFIIWKCFSVQPGASTRLILVLSQLVCVYNTKLEQPISEEPINTEKLIFPVRKIVIYFDVVKTLRRTVVNAASHCESVDCLHSNWDQFHYNCYQLMSWRKVSYSSGREMPTNSDTQQTGINFTLSQVYFTCKTKLSLFFRAKIQATWRLVQPAFLYSPTFVKTAISQRAWPKQIGNITSTKPLDLPWLFYIITTLSAFRFCS